MLHRIHLKGHLKGHLMVITNLLLSSSSSFLFKVWAETGEFRESNHNTMSSVTNMDNSNMNFQTPTIRRNRDKKSDGKSSKLKVQNSSSLVQLVPPLCHQLCV